jgi:replicative DNA helicase
MAAQTEPYSRDAEQYVLGAIMCKAEAFWLIADRVRAEDFFEPRHRELFEALAELCRDKKPCDAVTVYEQLLSAGNDPGSASYVIEVANNTPGAGNIVAHAEIVSGKAELRRVRAAGREIAKLHGDGAAGEAADLITSAARPTIHGIQTVKDALRLWHAGLSARFESSAEMSGVTYGLENLDKLTGGMQPGDLVLVAARPSMGKTALALHFARHAAVAMKADQKANGVLVFTLEMSTEQLMGRLMSSVARVGSDALRNPSTIEQEAWPRISVATQDLVELPIRFDESGTLTLDGLIAKSKQANAKSPVRVIVIDYLQLITPPKAENQTIGLAVITRSLKALAKDLGATCILLSQLNRECEKRADKRPIMSDLRDSGAIEQDADIILMPYRDEYYNADSAHKGIVELLVRKHRNGATGTVPLRGDLRFGRFDSMDEMPQEASAEYAPRGFGRYGKKPRADSSATYGSQQ